MDTDFIMDVLEIALKKYPKPKIFKSDQGSQYSTAVVMHQKEKNGKINLI